MYMKISGTVRKFQLTHPWGCDKLSNNIARARGHFNSHTREGVTIISRWTFGSAKFQLTHPWGCDISPCSWIAQGRQISTHTPVRVWRALQAVWTPETCHFNSHTREGVTLLIISAIGIYHISTHTPVRVWLYSCSLFLMVFTFQLTHPWGCDGIGLDLANWLAISTHTPVRVWPRTFSAQVIHIIFQLTHPWGCDIILQYYSNE